MQKQLTTILLMGLLSFLLGCKSNNTNSPTNNPFDTEIKEITSRIDPDQGWNDIFLKITKDTKTDISHIYIAQGLYKSKTVGLQIEISSKIGADIVNGEIDGEFGFANNAVHFKSLRQESDDLVKALAELYIQPINKTFT